MTAENVAREIRHLARGAGRARARIAPARRERDRERLLQGTDPAGRACIEEGRHRVRPADEHVRMNATRGRLFEAQARVREGKRHGDGGQRLGHQRRRCGRRADGARRSPKSAALKPFARLVSVRARGRRSGATWASARCPRRSKALERAGLKVGRSRRDRGQRGLRRAGLRRHARN